VLGVRRSCASAVVCWGDHAAVKRGRAAAPTETAGVIFSQKVEYPCAGRVVDRRRVRLWSYTTCIVTIAHQSTARGCWPDSA